MHWLLPADPNGHVLDVMHAMLGPARLVLDGRTVASIPKPTPVRPWVEHELAVDGQTITVALAYEPPVFAVDVFRDSRSLFDGRSLDVARAEAPPGVTRFEHWTNLGVSGIAELPVAPPWLTVLLLVALFLLTVAAIVVREGLLAGALAAAGLVILDLVLLRTWFIGIARTRLALIDVETFGDYARLGVFLLSVALGGIAVFLALFGVIVVLAAVQDLSQGS
jgi:hypothetical protein